MLQFTLPACDHAAHTHPLLQHQAPKGSNWKIKPQTSDFPWAALRVLAAFFSASVLVCLISFELWSCCSCSISSKVWGGGVMTVTLWETWGRAIWCDHSEPFPRPAGPCHQLMYEQVSGEVHLLYPLLLALFLQAVALCHAFLSLSILHSGNSQPYHHHLLHISSSFLHPVGFFPFFPFFLLSISCCSLPSPFSCSGSLFSILRTRWQPYRNKWCYDFCQFLKAEMFFCGVVGQVEHMQDSSRSFTGVSITEEQDSVGWDNGNVLGRHQSSQILFEGYHGSGSCQSLTVLIRTKFEPAFGRQVC